MNPENMSCVLFARILKLCYRHFYSYGSWGWDHSSFLWIMMVRLISASINLPIYTGESVKALFKTPFSGNMLVTLETDHVVSYQYVNVKIEPHPLI